MNTRATIEEKRDDILNLAARYGAYNVRIFGSIVRGTSTPESDIDFLVDMEPDRSLLDRIGLMQELEDVFGCKVDVVLAHALHRGIRDQVLQEAVSL